LKKKKKQNKRKEELKTGLQLINKTNQILLKDIKCFRKKFVWLVFVCFLLEIRISFLMDSFASNRNSSVLAIILVVRHKTLWHDDYRLYLL